MKHISLVLFFIAPCFCFGQPDFPSLQQKWLDTITAGESASSIYWKDRSLTYTKITTTDTESMAKLIRSEKITGFENYTHSKTYKHDDDRYVTVGSISTSSESILLLTGWRLVDEDWKKEIDVLLTKLTPDIEVGDYLQKTLDERRKTWVTLANKHDPEKHIEALYAKEATYFSNGQQSEGRNEIAQRYVYMENPDYQVSLKKEQVWKISDERVLENGRYFTGPEQVGSGGIYVILWEKTEEGWMIELDFNF